MVNSNGVVMARLNVGCGRNILPEWDNLDSVSSGEGVLVADLEGQLPMTDDIYDEFLLSHVIEHIKKPLHMMQELWRVAKPDAVMTIRCPYGSSDDADEDPTHVRRMFLQSFGYFSQPFYWRADYNYRGDWQPINVILSVDRTRHVHETDQLVLSRIMHERNLVGEMICNLKAVKPIREPLRELQHAPQILIRRL
jgi:hypothetical protein